LERAGHEGQRISVVIVSLWERERATVLIPRKLLERLNRYRNTGDFRVKKDCGEFVLETPRDEENYKLKDRLEDIFQYIPI
jgi:hypothetical protein